MLQRLAIALTITIGLLVPLNAQNNGRFCVRVFEDANNNAVQEPGEPSVTQGVAANLRARGSDVILQSLLVENSDTARSGEMCFAGLELGQYEITLTSATYNIPPGDDTVFTELTPVQTSIVSTYGVEPRPVSAMNVSGDDEVDTEALLERALVAGAGALTVMAVLAFIGVMIYVIALRPRQAATDTQPIYLPPDEQFRRPPASTLEDTGPTPAHRPDSEQGDDVDYNYRPPTEE